MHVTDCDPRADGPDFVDLRDPDLAEDLGTDAETLHATVRAFPSLGPVVARHDVLDLLALCELEQLRQENHHAH